MQIIVCVKAVPDTATRIKIASNGQKIDQEGVKYALGPYDARACAKAIELRDAIKGDSKVIAIASGFSDGERDAKKRLKDVLALGADKGVFIADPDPEHRDPLSVAQALAAAIKAQGKWDLVLFGRQAVDDQNLAVGPMTAALLGVACVTDAVALEVTGDKAVVTRAAESRTETIEVKLPACVTAQRDLAEEKYPKLKDILGAGKKPIETFAFAWPAPAWEVKKLSAPPPRQAGKIVGEGPDAVPKLLELLQSEAKALTF
ncbi:electron transfer flavoprotein subunit beta/FixA family protein [bacterium]|nr:electron transfer flavoprotein subunit beta/FixA family protein [bacterium]